MAIVSLWSALDSCPPSFLYLYVSWCVVGWAARLPYDRDSLHGFAPDNTIPVSLYDEKRDDVCEGGGGGGGGGLSALLTPMLEDDDSEDERGLEVGAWCVVRGAWCVVRCSGDELGESTGRVEKPKAVVLSLKWTY